MSRRLSRFWVVLGLIVVVGLAGRLVSMNLWAPKTGLDLGGDAVYYHEAANLLADGKGFIDPYRYLFGGSEQVNLPDGRIVEVITPVGHIEPTAGHPPVYVLCIDSSWSRIDCAGGITRALMEKRKGRTSRGSSHGGLRKHLDQRHCPDV